MLTPERGTNKVRYKMQRVKMSRDTIEMEKPLWIMSCGTECGFSVTDRDEKELIALAKEHIKHSHHRKMSSGEIMNLVDEVY
jgi:predicted small metal-binding protein